jgi:hypothetical protein
MATIYSKTPDGQHEIETRSRRLAPRARSTLILVDGKRSVSELGKLVQQVEETLQALLEAGLIEPANGKAEPAPAPEAPPAAAPSPAMAIVEFEALRRDAVRAVNDLLGPEAENLALKIERAGDADQLRAALERAVAYIANARGGGAAAQFASRFISNPTA